MSKREATWCADGSSNVHLQASWVLGLKVRCTETAPAPARPVKIKAALSATYCQHMHPKTNLTFPSESELKCATCCCLCQAPANVVAACVTTRTKRVWWRDATASVTTANVSTRKPERCVEVCPPGPCLIVIDTWLFKGPILCKICQCWFLQ